MSETTKTPVAVRVARWTAITAAITALGTIGNTFIDKKPWFLGGEEEKPAAVATPLPAPKVAAAAPEFEAPPSVHFSMPSSAERNEALEKHHKNLVETLVRSGRTPDEAKALASMSLSQMASSSAPQATMSGVPDMGWWRNTLNFIYYRPVAAWLIIGSVSLTLGAIAAEYLIRRKRRKMVMFDQPKT